MKNVKLSPPTERELDYFGDTITVIVYEQDGQSIRVPVPKGIFEYAGDGETVGMNFVFEGHYE